MSFLILPQDFLNDRTRNFLSHVNLQIKGFPINHETPYFPKKETPESYALKAAHEKLDLLAAHDKNALILSLHKVVACGTRVLFPPQDEKQAENYLTLLSGRRHRVYTAIIGSKGERKIQKIVMTHVAFKVLSLDEKKGYIASKEWVGCQGGYNPSGLAGYFIKKINGSSSNLEGFPLYEVLNILKGLNETFHF
jgi:septum formation protein